MQEDLLEALTFFAVGRQVIDEQDVLSLDQFDSEHDDQVYFQLRIGFGGEEVASWLSSRRELLDDLRRSCAIVQDAEFAWGDAQLLHDLHDTGGAWSSNSDAAQHLAASS